MHKALHESQDRRVEALIEQLQAPHWIERAKAAMSLGRIKDPAAIDSLETHLGDAHYLVRYHVTEALRQINTSETGEERLDA